MKIFLNCFDKITITKPKACRNASFESFVVCEGFKTTNEIIKKLKENDLGEEDMILLNNIELENNNNEEFSYDKYGIVTIQVGEEEYDSDKSYNLQCTDYKEVLNPVQIPINRPYKNYMKIYKDK